MTPDETRRRACLSLLIILIVLFDAFILAFGHYIDLSLDIRPQPLDILRAQVALIVAWLVFGTGHLAWRATWSCIALAVLWMLAMKYNADTNAIYPLPDMATMSLFGDVGAFLPCLLIFMGQRKMTGLTLVHERLSPSNVGTLRFQLRDILLITAACAVFAFLLRSVADHPYPRIPLTIRQTSMLRLVSSEYLVMTIVSSLIPGMLMGPCALVILKPNRMAWLWAVYFVVICALEPLIFNWLSTTPRMSSALGQPEPDWLMMYVTVVADNIWWYGVGLVPTMIVFILLRGAGVQVRETKLPYSSPASASPSGPWLGA